MIDANFNRSKEAMRVAEDITRFVLEDKKLTARWKQCRHHLTQTILGLPLSYREMVEARRAKSDVGRSSFIADRRFGVDVRDLLQANSKRAQEAMRVLEEFTKMVVPGEALHFQKLRFKLYELEKSSLSKF